eukprot:gene13154-15161_t
MDYRSFCCCIAPFLKEQWSPSFTSLHTTTAIYNILFAWEEDFPENCARLQFSAIRVAIICELNRNVSVLDDSEVEDLCSSLRYALGATCEEDIITIRSIQSCHHITKASSPALLENLCQVRRSLLQEALDNAIQLEATTWSRSRLNVVGYGGAGKTSLVRTLRDWQHNDTHASTSGVATSEVLVCQESIADVGLVVSTVQNWVSSTGQKEVDVSLKRACLAAINTTKKLSPVAIARDAVALEEPVDPNIVLCVEIPQPTPRIVAPVADVPAMAPIQQRNTFIGVRTDITVPLPSTLQALAQDSRSLTFSIWDFGGQKVFQTVQCLFMNRCGVYTIVFNMLDVLEDDITLSVRALNYVATWMRLIHTYAQGAPIFIVGTHLDSISANRRGTANQVIDCKLQHTFQENNLYGRENLVFNGALCFWPVDNLNRDEEFVSNLRNQITQSVLTDSVGYINTPVAVTWLALCDQLKEQSKLVPFIPLSSSADTADAVTVAHLALKLGIISSPEGEEFALSTTDSLVLTAIMNKLNELGIILYFDKPLLRNCVFLDPQWLINKVVYLVRDIQLHRFERDRVALNLHRPLWNLLFDHGIAARSLLKVFWVDDDATIGLLLNLLQEIGIMCCLPTPAHDVSPYHINSGSYYFIPASAMFVENSDDPNQFEDTADADAQFSVVVKFTAGMLPIGFLDRFLVSLVHRYVHLLDTKRYHSLFKFTNGAYVSELLLDSGDTCVNAESHVFDVQIVPRAAKGSIGVICSKEHAPHVASVLHHHAMQVISAHLSENVDTEFEVIQTFCEDQGSNWANDECSLVAECDSDASSDGGNDEIAVEDIPEGDCRDRCIRAFTTWLESMPSPLNAECVQLYACSFVDGGYMVSNGVNPVDLLLVRFREHGAVVIADELQALGITVGAHQVRILELLATRLDQQIDEPAPFCIAFCDSEHYTKAEEIVVIEQALTMKALTKRVFRMSVVAAMLKNAPYSVVHMCSTCEPSTTATSSVRPLRTFLNALRNSAAEYDSFMSCIAAHRNVQCVVLNASQSYGAATQLCREGLSFAVGWETCVDSVAAAVFSGEFYRCLNNQAIPAYEEAYRSALAALQARNFVLWDPNDSVGLATLRRNNGQPTLRAAGVPKLLQQGGSIVQIASHSHHPPQPSLPAASLLNLLQNINARLGSIETSAARLENTTADTAIGEIKIPSLFLILPVTGGKNMFRNKLMVVFLCPLSGRVKYGNKDGLTFTVPKKWLADRVQAMCRFKDKHPMLVALTAFAISAAVKTLSGVSLSDIVPPACRRGVNMALKTAEYISEYAQNNMTAAFLDVFTEDLSLSDVVNNAAVGAVIGQEYRKFEAFLEKIGYDSTKLPMHRVVDDAGHVQWVASRFTTWPSP